MGASADLVGRDFTAERPNELWVADITEFDTAEGKLHLAGVSDKGTQYTSLAFTNSLEAHGVVAVRITCHSSMNTVRRPPNRGKTTLAAAGFFAVAAYWAS